MESDIASKEIKGFPDVPRPEKLPSPVEATEAQGPKSDSQRKTVAENLRYILFVVTTLLS